jgi:hypothetical protein
MKKNFISSAELSRFKRESNNRSKIASFFEIFTYLPLVLFSLQSVIDGFQLRYAHGDGSYKFIYVLSKYYTENSFILVDDPRIARDYIVAVKEFIAYLILNIGQTVEFSFKVFSITIAIFYVLLYTLMFVSVKKHFNNWFGLVSSFTLLVLAATSLSFPDSEIIMAAPIIVLWSIFFKSAAALNLKQKRIWLVGISTLLFGSEIHEAFILVLAINFVVFIIDALILKTINRAQALLVLFSIIPLSKGVFNGLIHSKDAATEKSIFFDSVFFNFKLWMYKPTLFLLCAIFLFFVLISFLHLDTKKAQFSWTFLIPITMAICIGIYLLHNYEDKRINNPWSFVESRQDLFWVSIIFSASILLSDFNSIRLKTDKSSRTLIIVFVCFYLLMISLFSFRFLESISWKACKERQFVVTEKLRLGGNTGVINRDIWKISDCDWLWADPGTIYLIYPQNHPIVIPDGVDSPAQRLQWPEPPRISSDGEDAYIFGLSIPPNNQIKVRSER